MKIATYQTGSNFITLTNSTMVDREDLRRNRFDIRKNGKSFLIGTPKEHQNIMFRVCAKLQSLGYELKTGI